MSQTHPCTKVIDTFRKEETKLKTSATAGGPTWEFHSINYHENSLKTSFHPDSTPKKEKNKSRESPLISVIGSSSGVVPSTDSITLQVLAPQEPAGVGLRSKPIAKQNQEDSEVSSIVNHNSSKSKTDSKRAKQQFAQRSRLKKLQYIAQLERSAEESQVSANLEYLYRQSLILGMENQALRQRLVSLSQEQLAKY
uniref:BZIP domain-containing protein n=1 Tax=Salix viminalis TaxID=40686 RepID=A0A6N2LDM7_SALVM